MSTVLLILDGWGNREAALDNAISVAHTPNWDKLLAQSPHTLIKTDGLAVGLPEGQMGNSEVGHMNIGAGRVVYQDFTRISLAANQQFQDNEVLCRVIDDTKGALHVLALLSDGGVHSHEDHVWAFLELAVARGASRIVVHAFLDGRDTPPKSAAASLEKLANLCTQYPQISLADVSGRYYAMDRDRRWERTGAVFDLITQGQGEFSAASGAQALAQAYARGETDEFVRPTVIAPQPMQDGDSVVFINFRSDRARQLTQLFLEENFIDYDVSKRPKLAHFVTMTQYRADFPAEVAFPPQSIEDTLGQVVAKAGLKQLRTAETEKYPHVTYFFNGGVETPLVGERREVIPSPKVATYDLQPEMSVAAVADVLIDGIDSGEYALLVCNFANPDMVGHTGVMPAVIKAVEAVDVALGRVLAAVERNGASILVTADHGNCEQMLDSQTGQPHTAHTTNLVPLVYKGSRSATLQAGGALCDLAPTLLSLLNLPQPAAMTGKSLLRFTSETAATPTAAQSSATRMAYLNGDFIPAAEARISIFDRGFLMADSVYEVTAVLHGKALDSREHYLRLCRSAGELNMPTPLSETQWHAIQKALITQHRLTEGLIYCQVTRGTAERNFEFDPNMPPTVVMFTQCKDITNNSLLECGQRVMTQYDVRWQRCDIKTTQLLAQSLAKMIAKDAGFDDAWFIDDAGYITEGSSNNAWIIKGKKVYTRPADYHILNGITRQSLLHTLNEAGYQVIEKAFTLQEAIAADGAFSTSATSLLLPVTYIDNYPIANGTVPASLLSLRQRFIAYLLEKI